jgi:Sec-independent protein translocase protein TatA
MGGWKPRHWRTTVFDLSVGKLLVLAVLVALIFGPGVVRRLAGHASRTLRSPRQRS